jgi:hypothetical protein
MTPFPAPADSRVEESLLGRISARWVRELEIGSPVRFQVIEPAFVAAFEAAWIHADSPEVAAIAARVNSPG